MINFTISRTIKKKQNETIRIFYARNNFEV